jgi:hypothetical protein
MIENMGREGREILRAELEIDRKDLIEIQKKLAR